jgi:hypothetical protein
VRDAGSDTSKAARHCEFIAERIGEFLATPRSPRGGAVSGVVERGRFGSAAGRGGGGFWRRRIDAVAGRVLTAGGAVVVVGVG